MLSRRDLFVTGAALTQLRPDGAEAAQRATASEPELRALMEIRDALNGLRHPAVSTDVDEVRRRQHAYLKQNQRYPEYIDVGLSVWGRLQDWHIENQKEMKITRSPEGRYLMEFMMTQLVLRPEISDAEIGLAYDR